jgi:hypothetical protein
MNELAVRLLQDVQLVQSAFQALLPARSTQYLPQSYQQRCVPNRGRWLLPVANARNGGESTTSISSDAKRSTSAGLRSHSAKVAAQASAMVSALI